MKKKELPIITLLLILSFSLAFAQQRPFYDKSNDILIAQFDSKPDPDDIHAQAAFGSMLAHDDLRDVNYYAVAGAVGTQGGRFIDSDALFDMAFGNNWTDADANRQASVTRIKDKVIPILQNGGKVWVQEAGQSDITADWVREVLKTINEATVKSNVIVVQHSDWNEDMTTNSDLNYIKNRTNYFAIDDGNAPIDASWGDRGPWQTPEYRSKNNSWIDLAKSSPNLKAKQLWIEADRVIQNHGHFPSHSTISTGGIDYSDCVENWWILNIGNNADTVGKFWSRYVTNTDSTEDPNDNPNCDSTISEATPSSDAYLQGSTLFNDANLRTENGNRLSYLKFTVPTVTQTVAAIKLKLAVSVDGGNGNIEIYKGSTNNWNETNLSNNNKPSENGLLGSLNTTYSIGQTYEWNLTGITQGETISLIVKQTGGNDVSFSSKEGNNPPQLVLEHGDCTLSTSDNVIDNEIKLFPNPADNNITIKNAKGEANIYDLYGRKILSDITISNSNNTVDISTLPSGMYLLVFDDSRVAKFLKQ